MGTGRVYIRFDKEYLEKYEIFGKLDFLIEAVALSVRCAYGKKLIKNESGNQIICLAQTKKFIAKEATQLIKQIGIIYDGDHMARYSSKRQINTLIGVCLHKKNFLPCYAFIILHIIYTNINQSVIPDIQNDLIALKNIIFILANECIKYHAYSDLSKYIIDCYSPIEKEISTGLICQVRDFPDIHRWY